jgi:hypothetical protein
MKTRVAWVEASKREGSKDQGNLRIIGPRLMLSPQVHEAPEEVLDSIVVSMIVLGQKLTFARGFYVTEVESRQYVGETPRLMVMNGGIDGAFGDPY